MKKIVYLLTAVMLGMNACFAYEMTNQELLKDISMQHVIDSIAYDMLNVAQIKNRMIFTYDKDAKKKLLKCNDSLTKRQVLIYGDNVAKVADKNELAALIAREIVKADASYWGNFKGYIGATQIRCAPKKYELYFDKNRIVKSPGYEIYMENIDSAHFYKKEDGYYLWFKKQNKTYDFELY